MSKPGSINSLQQTGLKWTKMNSSVNFTVGVRRGVTVGGLDCTKQYGTSEKKQAEIFMSN